MDQPVPSPYSPPENAEAARRAAEGTELEKKVWQEIATVDDPEIGFSIVDLGLVYDLMIDEGGTAHVKMTFTSMACPAGPQLQSGVHSACLRVEGIRDAEVDIVFSPPWDPREMATQDIQEMMGIY